MFYEFVIQIGLWFIVTFLVLFLSNNEPNFLQFILWTSSGAYFIFSWIFGGQTLAMRAWKLKLVSPNESLWFYFSRYLLVTVGGILFFLSFFWAIFNKKNKYLHDIILGSEIIDARS